MKVAEALAERADAVRRVEQLRARIIATAGTVALSHRVILLPEFFLFRRGAGCLGPPQATVTGWIAASSVAAARSEQNYFR